MMFEWASLYHSNRAVIVQALSGRASAPLSSIATAMHMMTKSILAIALLGLAVTPGSVLAQTTNIPWSPQNRCSLNPSRPQGLHPGAISALKEISLVHRVTQGLNP